MNRHSYSFSLPYFTAARTYKKIILKKSGIGKWLDFRLQITNYHYQYSSKLWIYGKV